jgi:hypothetical protein
MKQLTVPSAKVEILSRVNLVAVFCVSACILCGIRFLSPLFIGSDPSTQIGAGLNLLTGSGMGNYALKPDISQPPATEFLTWFAPALSILIAGLVKLGLTVDLALKVIYMTATIAGWYGWGVLFREVKTLTNSRNIFAEGIAIALGIVLPLYFTFDWSGTDLLLWSVIPFILYALYSDRHFFRSGLLTGFAYSIRYAAVSLLLGQIAFLIATRKFKQIGSVVLGYAIFYIPVSVYRAIAGSEKADHVSASNLLDPQLLISRVQIILLSFKNAEYLLLSHLTHKMPFEKFAAIFAGIGLVLSGYFLIKKQENQSQLARLSQIILFFNTSLIAFLILVSFASSNGFLHITEARYFYPLFPSLILTAYGASFYFSEFNNLYSKLVRGLAGFYLGIFVIGTFHGLITSRSLIFGFHYFSAQQHLVEYPSRQIITRHPQSYKALISLMEKNLDRIAISFAEDFDYRHTSNSNVRRRILPASSTFVPKNMTSQTVKVYGIFAIDAQCSSYCYFDSGKQVTVFKSLSDLKTEYTNPAEKIRIVSSTLAKGSQFKLNYNVPD